MPRLHVVLALALCVAAVSGTPALAQASDPIVFRDVRHDVSVRLRDMPAAARPSGPAEEIPVRPVPRSGTTQNVADPVVQTSTAATVVSSTGTSFDGVGNGFTGPNGTYTVNVAPPDTNGAVGPNHYVQWVNLDFAVFDKSGNVLYGPVPGNTIWNGFGGNCQTNNAGDPIVQYDRAADRWVMSQLGSTSGSYSQCFAVSTTGDPLGTYNRYEYSFGSYLNDYPKIGVWPSGYFASYNMFRSGISFQGARICAYDRAAMLAGASATSVCYQLSSSFGGLLPADLDGATAPPAGAPNYFVNFGSSSLNVWKFTPNFTTPSASTLSGPVNLPVAAFSIACGGGSCIPQPGTSNSLDSLGDRLMYRLAYRNFGDHEALVVNHSVAANGVVGVRWYEIRNPAAAPVVYQQGTFAPDSTYRWMGSAAMDQAGNIAIGYSISSSAVKPSLAFTARNAGDPLGTLAAETVLFSGTGVQTGTLHRWGDYSALRVDPSDDCTFWFTTEYLPSNGSWNWRTRIVSFKLSTCGTASAPAAPVLSATAGNAQVALSWTAASGATSYDLQRSTTSGTGYSTIASGLTSTSYTDTALVNGTTYYYIVQAVNSIGTTNSNEASATPVCSAPGTPTGVSATAGDNQVALSWTAASGAAGYFIKRSTSPTGGFSALNATAVAATSYTDTTAVNGTTYYYVVSAVNGCGESGDSSPAASATPQPVTAPAPPSNLTASTPKAKNNLSWTQSTTPGVTQNKIYRSTTNGSGYALLAAVPAGTSYSDRSVTSGTTYYYVVTAVANGVESAYSNQAAANTR